MTGHGATRRDELGADVARIARLRSLLAIRVVNLAELLRRSATLANRRRFGLSALEWRIMTQVGSHAPLSLSELAELLGLDRGQLSRAVKAMAARGLLLSQRRPGSPAIMITLGVAGDAIHAEMVELVAERNDFLIGDIDADEIERAAAVLATIGARARLLLDREQALARGD